MVLIGVAGTAVLLIVLLVSWRWTRAVIVGWLFFFITILPTMQIVRFSDVIASDKFAYIPSFGLLLPLACAVTILWNGAGSSQYLRRGLISLAIFVPVFFEIGATRNYLAVWKDSETLYRHMIRLAPDAAVPYFESGCTLREQGRMAQARREFRLAVDLNPRYPQAHNNLAKVLELKGDIDGAIRHFRAALKLKPDHESHFNLAGAYIRARQTETAVDHYKKAIAIKNDYHLAHNNLAAALTLQKKYAEAVVYYENAIRIRPEYADAHRNYGITLLQMGREEKAVYHLKKAVQINPNDTVAANALKKLQQSD